MNKINNFQSAVALVCSLCDAKMKNEVYSISCRSHSMKLYNTLKMRGSRLCRELTARSFVEAVESLKNYLEQNNKQSLIDKLYDNNITLFNYSKEVEEAYRAVVNNADLHHIIIDNIENVVMMDGKYYYSTDEGMYELMPEGSIIRQTDPTKHTVDNVIVYLGIPEFVLRKKTGAIHPSRGWYSMKFGANYYYTSNCMVKNWYMMSDDRKVFAGEE